MPTRQTSLSSAKNSKGLTTGGETLTTGLADENFYLPFFHYQTIPKNTAITSYVTHTQILPISQCERLWVEFPSGCAGLVGMQLYHGAEQIFPLPAGDWFRSDGFVFGFRFSHLWDKEPFEVVLRAYNIDDTYQHTIWYALELKGLPTKLSDTMRAFIKTLQV